VALGESFASPVQYDNVQEASLWGPISHHSCHYKGRTSETRVILYVEQFANDEAAANFFNNIEGLSEKSPAVTHPTPGEGVRALQVTGPGYVQAHLLRKDVVLTLEIHQPSNTSDTVPKASLALLRHIVARLR